MAMTHTSTAVALSLALSLTSLSLALALALSGQREEEEEEKSQLMANQAAKYGMLRSTILLKNNLKMDILAPIMSTLHILSSGS